MYVCEDLEKKSGFVEYSTWSQTGREPASSEAPGRLKLPKDDFYSCRLRLSGALGNGLRSEAIPS